MGNELLTLFPSFLCHSINVFMSVDEVRLTSLQVIVSSFLVLSLSYFLFLKRENTANTGFTFITARVRLTPGCEFWGQLHCMRILVEKSSAAGGNKATEKKKKSETLAAAAVYLEESLRPFGARYFGGHWNPVPWIPALSHRGGGDAVRPRTDRQEPLVTTAVWTRCPESVCSSAASSPVRPPLCLPTRGYAIAANMMWCVELSEWHQAGTNVFI